MLLRLLHVLRPLRLVNLNMFRLPRVLGIIVVSSLSKVQPPGLSSLGLYSWILEETHDFSELVTTWFVSQP